LIRAFSHLLIAVCLAQALPGNLCVCWLPHAVAHDDCEHCPDSCPFHDEDWPDSESGKPSSQGCHCSLKNSDAKIFCEPESPQADRESFWLNTVALPLTLSCNKPSSHLALQKTHPPFLPRHLLLGVLLI
jgi:hypothetical protein